MYIIPKKTPVFPTDFPALFWAYNIPIFCLIECQKIIYFDINGGGAYFTIFISFPARPISLCDTSIPHQ